ncbi:zinc finger protein 717 isoform X2 [Bicyclus anynana]|uniref:Zinc finger protein 717 isoform X2 n=1 Tax=Bicyclus anynana TaxID=110368 RepID=A0A6J1NV83_BICAN|nr:zinc finger protein 717 isoform X2 [Bicyclus anynana]
MESRKETLGIVKICRFCLVQNRPLGTLYDKAKSKTTVTLPLKILTNVSIEVLPSDKKPTFICDRCKFYMNLFYEYKHIVRQADESIHQYVHNGTPLAAVSWPVALSKIFRTLSEPDTVKTVVEGGATIQVTSHDISDSDEEDGNVYNVKIGDDEDTKCIKVVTSKDTKAKENARGQDASNVEDKDSEKIEEGCFPCDECNCTYPLQQLLNLHKMQKHRTRDVACSQCDAKFFTKYDLAAHAVRHSMDMPFECVACGKKFKRLILLKRHEKMIHPDIPQLLCPNCPATFLSNEQLDMHQKKHIRLQKPYACTQCDKKFHEKSALQRHVDVVHNKEATLCCEYCPERFGSISKLARHVRSHVGERPYPCKYCEKSFTKSHHYTRHFRLKHREQARTSGANGQQEQYRCEQCEDVFDSQDDLIYHSAIHATQNLTCPLCQEKFEDVEAVTTHIKSHVNGVEFMCDYCELIFTTQEKLDNHMMIVHDDELQNELDDESSLEMDENEDDDTGINIKEEGDDMIIEIKKPDNYLVTEVKDDTEEKMDVTNSEESESEATYTELQTVDTLAIISKNVPKPQEKVPSKPAVTTTTTDNIKIVSKPVDNQTSNILRKAEEIKRKAPPSPAGDAVIIRKAKPVTKVESSNSGGASDKSLRLLEKELQDLKRTNSRNTETNKTPNKVLESSKSKRPQFQTSTPKLRSAEDKKILNKSFPLEKKQLEKRVLTKENKEPKETKEIKNNGNSKEEKDKEKDKEKEKDKDNNEKDFKEKEKEKISEKDKAKETPKSIVKNGAATEKANTEDGVRRSTRPSKIKDYAKMIREVTQELSDDDETTEDDEDYCEPDKSTEIRRGRRPSQVVKVTPAKTPPATPANPPRKRGRPRKDNKQVPAKIKKEEETLVVKKEEVTSPEKEEIDSNDTSSVTDVEQSVSKTPEPTNTSTNVMVSPSGQTLKKVPVKALPPGVKAMPLPRTMPAELCEMQIGKKVVKVQKIVMTKAEVEAMAKQGLVEMKGGTMVLKQGIKLSDASAVKSSVSGDGGNRL